jgi:hypothetical protein
MRSPQIVKSPDGERWRVRRRWMDRSPLRLCRPWIVEARNLAHPEHSVAFAVRGWRRSGEAIVELRRAIPAGGPPVRLAGGVAIPASAEGSSSGRRAGR